VNRGKRLGNGFQVENEMGQKANTPWKEPLPTSLHRNEMEKSQKKMLYGKCGRAATALGSGKKGEGSPSDELNEKLLDAAETSTPSLLLCNRSQGRINSVGGTSAVEGRG